MSEWTSMKKRRELRVLFSLAFLYFGCFWVCSSTFYPLYITTIISLSQFKRSRHAHSFFMFFRRTVSSGPSITISSQHKTYYHHWNLQTRFTAFYFVCSSFDLIGTYGFSHSPCIFNEDNSFIHILFIFLDVQLAFLEYPKKTLSTS